MTTSAISKLLGSYLGDIEGRDGFWKGTREGVTVFVFSDESHDRMRMMAPVGQLQEPDRELLQVLLRANYDRALDARYAMRDDELWAVTVHPLATLAPDDFAGFLDQVVHLVKNTGTTFASSELLFLARSEDDEDAPGGESPSEGSEES